MNGTVELPHPGVGGLWQPGVGPSLAADGPLRDDMLSWAARQLP